MIGELGALNGFTGRYYDFSKNFITNCDENLRHVLYLY
jgi:hypothetical protein